MCLKLDGESTTNSLPTKTDLNCLSCVDPSGLSFAPGLSESVVSVPYTSSKGLKFPASSSVGSGT